MPSLPQAAPSARHCPHIPDAAATLTWLWNGHPPAIALSAAKAERCYSPPFASCP